MATGQTNDPFRTLDSTAATGYAGSGDNSLSAPLLHELARNLNHLNQDLVQPCLSRGYEVADPWGDDKATSLHSFRVNAPAGAWTFLVPPTVVRVPPGVTQLELDMHAKLASGSTATIFAMSNAQPFTLDSTADAFSLTGDGTEKTYPATEGDWRFDVRPDASGYALIAVAAQTSGGTVLAMDAGTDHHIDNSQILRSQSDSTLATFDGTWMRQQDTWIRLEGLTDVVKAWRFDKSAGTYTELTSLDSTGAGENVFPSGPGQDDEFIFGAERPFHGAKAVMSTQGDTVMTVTWQYADSASTWANLTMLTDGDEIGDFDVSTNSNGHMSVWDPPTDWIRSTISTDDTELFYAKAKIATFTSSSTEAQIDRMWLLTPTQMPWTRVLFGNDVSFATDRYLLAFQQPRFLGDTSSTAYVVARADLLDVYAIHIDPVGMSLAIG